MPKLTRKIPFRAGIRQEGDRFINDAESQGLGAQVNFAYNTQWLATTQTTANTVPGVAQDNRLYVCHIGTFPIRTSVSHVRYNFSGPGTLSTGLFFLEDSNQSLLRLIPNSLFTSGNSINFSPLKLASDVEVPTETPIFSAMLALNTGGATAITLDNFGVLSPGNGGVSPRYINGATGIPSTIFWPSLTVGAPFGLPLVIWTSSYLRGL